MQSIAALLAGLVALGPGQGPAATSRPLALALQPPPPPPPPAADTAAPEPTTPSPVTPTEPTTVPDPVIPPPTTKPGTPKRVYMPGTKQEPVVLPTPVEPTPIKPTPVQPSGPQPVLPGTEPDEGKAVAIVPDDGNDEPTPRRRDRRRRDRTRTSPTVDDGGSAVSDRCLAPLQRCRTLAITGIALSVTGAALAGGGGALLGQPQTPLREDPTMVKSFRPPGAVMVALGGGLVITGIAVLAAGIVAHRRDASMRRRTALLRSTFGVRVLP